MTRIRCKFKVQSVEDCYPVSDPTAPGGTRPQKKVTLATEYDPACKEDEAFTKYTPSGTLVATIDNPAAVAVLEVGKAFYVDLTPVEG